LAFFIFCVTLKIALEDRGLEPHECKSREKRFIKEDEMGLYDVVVHSSGSSAVDFCEDVFSVRAPTPQAAIAEARRRFDAEILPHWPHLCVEDAFVLPEDVDCDEFELCDAIR
jgi:hypothetical protein